jgi:hypothetical protein
MTLGETRRRGVVCARREFRQDPLEDLAFEMELSDRPAVYKTAKSTLPGKIRFQEQLLSSTA